MKNETTLNIETKLNAMGYSWFKIGVDNENYQVTVELPKFRYLFKNKKKMLKSVKENLEVGFSVSMKFS